MWRGPVATILAAVLCCACGRGAEEPGRVIRVWSHQGQEAENEAMREIVAAFNRAHADRKWRVEIDFFPDYQYTEKVSIAAAARDLPDAMDLDGPTVAQFVEAGLLEPLDRWFPEAEQRDFLDTIIEQGTIDGQLYALGAFDSALVLYYDKKMLARAAVSPPPYAQSWRWEEFLAACRRLKAAGIDPVSMHMNESADEWYTYAFSPLIWSAGGRLIAKDGVQVEGVLNAPVNVRALERWRRVFEENLAALNPVDPNRFGNGKTAMDWSGHWMYRAHRERKGEALGIMPVPRMGETAATGSGTWCWAITTQSRSPDRAAVWIRWVTSVEHGIRPMMRASAAVPARKSTFDVYPRYRKEPYPLFQRLLETSGRPRPRTPFYSALTQHFAAALRDIAHGADVEERLNKAAAHIQRVVDRRRGEGA